MRKDKDVLLSAEKLMDWIAVLAIFYMILSSLVFGLLGKPAEMGIAVAAGGLACAFANLRHFESFKGAGFSGQLRRKVDQHAVQLEHLTRLAIALGRPVLGIMKGGGRWGGLGRDRMVEMHDYINKELIKLGLSEKDMSTVNEFWNWYEAFDLIADILAHQPESVRQEDIAAINDEKRLILDYTNNKIPSYDEAKKFLERWFSKEADYEILTKRLDEYKVSLLKYEAARRAQGLPSVDGIS
ncbi:hypothetical protein [Azospirillum sp. ST 5-10]|uniref:hypothetical protein n=1 Tax=unclassified Azospirillum TaxID=2630922 RepID=UPI003F4A5FB8